MARLILWVAEALIRILKQIHGQRQASKLTASTCPPVVQSTSNKSGETVFDEVCDVIHMPAFSGQDTVDPADVELDPKVTEQVENFVSGIADMCKYCSEQSVFVRIAQQPHITDRQNPFHNFEQ